MFRRPTTSRTILAFAVLAAGCGASSGYRYEQQSYAQGNYGGASTLAVATEQAAERDYSRAPRTEVSADSAPAGSPPPSPAPVTVTQSLSSRPSGESYKKSSYRAPPPQQPQQPSPPPQQAQPQTEVRRKAAKAAEVNEPMVVYLGYLKLRVKRTLEAIDAVTDLVQKSGGYVQSMSAQVMVVRIPAGDFDGAMAALSELGEVLDRRVKALDVSQQFTDIDARLAVALQARERLLALLKTVQNVEERLMILEEVKRLSEQIESMESSLATLRNLANYFTITIELEPIVPNTNTIVHRSPFAWLRAMQAYVQILNKGKTSIAMDLPRGFVLFDKDDAWRAQAADTSMLRAAKVENDPRGDSVFWSDAVQHEMDGRDEELVSHETLQTPGGPLPVRVYRNKDVRPRYWVIAVQVQDKDVYVLEAFLPDEAAWRLHKSQVMQAFASFHVK